MSITMKNINMNFKEKHALNNISMEFPDNKITGLIGFNGSGKTTSFNIITDFLDQTSGEILVDGKAPTREFYKQISYISGSTSKGSSEKAINELRYFAALYGYPKEHALEKINELAKVLEFEEFLKTKISALSKGNQQKIKVMQALLNPNIKYLLLDEPFDGFDPHMVVKLKQYIISIAKDITIIITSHRMDIVDDMTDDYYVLKEGVIVNTRADIIKNANVIVHVNKETSLDGIEDLPFVKSVKKVDQFVEIWIESIEDFKKLTRHLLDAEGYVFHTLKQKTATDAFLEGAV